MSESRAPRCISTDDRSEYFYLEEEITAKIPSQFSSATGIKDAEFLTAWKLRYDVHKIVPTRVFRIKSTMNANYERISVCSKLRGNQNLFHDKLHRTFTARKWRRFNSDSIPSLSRVAVNAFSPSIFAGFYSRFRRSSPLFSSPSLSCIFPIPDSLCRISLAMILLSH